MDPYYDLDAWAGRSEDRSGDTAEAEQAHNEVQNEKERRRRVMESLLAGVPFTDSTGAAGGTATGAAVPSTHEAVEPLAWRRVELEEHAALESEVSARVRAHQEAIVRERAEAEEDELRMLEKDATSAGGAGAVGSSSGGDPAVPSFAARVAEMAQKRATLNVNVNMNTASVDEQAADRAESEQDLRARFRREIETAQLQAAANKGR